MEEHFVQASEESETNPEHGELARKIPNIRILGRKNCHRFRFQNGFTATNPLRFDPIQYF